MVNGAFLVLEGKSSILFQWLVSVLKEQDGTVLGVRTCLNAKMENSGMFLVFSVNVRMKLFGMVTTVKRR